MLPARLWALLNMFLKQRLRFNLEVFELDQLVVFWKASKSGKCLPSLYLTTMMLKPSWTEWHEDLDGLALPT